MRITHLLAVVAIVLASAGTAFGHGFALSLNGNAITATSNDFPGNGNPNLFFAELAPSGGFLRSTHGGAGTSLFGTGKSLSFDVFTPLLFSDGSGNPATPAASGIALQIESQSLVGNISVDGEDLFTPGFAITGNTSHEFRWTFNSAAPYAEGLYGLAYRVKGGPAAGGSYESSPLLVVAFMTPGFFPGDDPLAPNSPLSLATAAIYSAATNPVPEPSTCVLLGMGAIGLIGYQLRRRRALHG